MPTAAIYARKSMETDKGESVENQINRGIALCQLNGWNHVVYQDYGVSGKTLEREDFERMMKDARSHKLDYIVCYKLDRVSRSVNDFSSLIEELNALGIGFICIKDNFDTTTPMGRAMMMITAVFAQLERETTAERVKDNMIDRAKLGKWNGGPVPLGFDVHSETSEYQGRKKKASTLLINETEADIIKKIYELYIEQQSVRSTTANLNQLGYRTKNGSDWSPTQVSRILQNPLYCIADKDAYDYFSNNTTVQIINSKNDFIGEYGLMYYNRRKPHKKGTKNRDETEWILVKGEHQGIIPGEIVKKVHNLMKSNKTEAPRTGTSARTPLINVKCDICGQAMSVYSARNTKDSPYVGHYRCNRKVLKGIACANRNVKSDLLEAKVVQIMSKLYDDENSVLEAINAYNSQADDKRIPLISERQKISIEISNIENEVKNLVVALGKNTLPELLIQQRFSELQKQKNLLQARINEVENELNESAEQSYSIDETMKYIKKFKYAYYNLPFEDRKKLLSGIVKEVRINNDKVKLELYFLPDHMLDDTAFCSRTDKD